MANMQPKTANTDNLLQSELQRKIDELSKASAMESVTVDNLDPIGFAGEIDELPMAQDVESISVDNLLQSELQRKIEELSKASAMESVTVDKLDPIGLAGEINELPMAQDVKSISVDADSTLEPNEFDELSKDPKEMTVKIYTLSDGEDFERKILELRRLAKHTSIKVGDHEVDVLPRLVTKDLKKNVEFLDIKLELTSTQSQMSENKKADHVTLRLRRDNLYILGYKADNVWFELGDVKNLIHKETVFLNLGENYTELLKAAGFQSIDGLTALEHPNFIRLQNAAEWLSQEKKPLERTTKKDNENRARFLLTLMVMFSETARSKPTLDYLKGKFWDDNPTKLPDGIDKIAHKWGNSSKLIINNQKEPCKRLGENEQLHLNIEGEAIDAETILELSKIFEILQDSPKEKEGDEAEEVDEYF